MALRWSAAVTGLFLLAAGSIYLWSGTIERQEARFAQLDPTLDGLAFLSSDPLYVEDQSDREPANDVSLSLSDDRPLIDWLRANVEGSPVIVEATGGLYHWTGRFSQYTGLPAVIGWDWHQTQQRWGYSGEVTERRHETDRFWRDPNPAQAAAYLRKYNVSYVVVGSAEVALYADGLPKLATMEALTEVYRDGDYAIYRVDQSALPVPTFDTITIDGETRTTASPGLGTASP